jgi:L-asparaginase II
MSMSCPFGLDEISPSLPVQPCKAFLEVHATRHGVHGAAGAEKPIGLEAKVCEPARRSSKARACDVTQRGHERRAVGWTVEARINAAAQGRLARRTGAEGLARRSVLNQWS